MQNVPLLTLLKRNSRGEYEQIVGKEEADCESGLLLGRSDSWGEYCGRSDVAASGGFLSAKPQSRHYK